MTSSKVGDTSKIINSRHGKLATELQSAGIQALVLNPGPSLTYLSGLHFHLSERPIIAIFVPHEPVILVLPELESPKAKNLPYPVQVFPYGEDPRSWGAAFHQAFQAARAEGGRVGAEPRRMRMLEMQYLLSATPETEFISAEKSLAALRMYKDESEVMAMRKAAEIAQNALLATLPLIKTGMTEKELAAELTLQLLRAGSEAEIPFQPIVSAGPNSANPHATPTQRPLTPGDLLVIDWGACFEGYYSDITRTFAIGEVEAEMERICQIVLEANTAGRQVVRPNIPAGEVDRVTRAVIEKAGYGKFFIHRTGHGLGIEGHEEPYIRADNEQLLAPGMTFTIEPGIYLPDRGGVRIEDDVLVNSEGVESFTDLPREVKRLA